MKALSPIVVTDSGKITEVILVHPLKALVPSVVTDSGRIIVVMAVQ